MNSHLDELLDEHLAATAPPVAERTPALRRAISDLVDQTGQLTAPSRSRRRLAAAAFGVTAIVGAGSAAAAAGWVPWYDDPGATTQQTTGPSGDACSLTYAPRALEVEGHPVSATDRSAAMDFAADFLRDFDVSAIKGASLERVFVVLDTRLAKALEAQGLSTHAVSVALATDCRSGSAR